MYAIVDIAGQQFKVEKDRKVFVHRLEGQEGSNVEFDQVLLIDNDKDVTVGTPVISGAMVTAKILEHMKGDKVIVFKKKRRKGYQKSNGHRQYMTQIQIEDIIEKGAAPKVAAKKEVVAEKKQEPVQEVAAEQAAPKVKKAEPKAETAPKAEVKAVKQKSATSAKKAAPKT
ncbi:MAG: 50S ribosomal protein L21, partial [Bacteroidales bacterium]|nr:50S ribosomal protein L21 [Bacteroidales bacterium]